MHKLVFAVTQYDTGTLTTGLMLLSVQCGQAEDYHSIVSEMLLVQ